MPHMEAIFALGLRLGGVLWGCFVPALFRCNGRVSAVLGAMYTAWCLRDVKQECTLHCLCFPFVAGHERIPARSGRLAVRAYNMVAVPRLVTGSSGGVNELAPDRLQFEQ